MFHATFHGTHPVKKWEPRKHGEPHHSITGIFKVKTLG